MAPTTIEAASYVRARLGQMDTRISQEEMTALIRDLQQNMGRVLTRSEVSEVVEVFRDVAAVRSNPAACAA